MKIINVEQGAAAWHEHRAKYYRSASRAPAMMGASPYQSRSELLAEIATGITPDHDAATLDRFERGHAVEPALRAYAERIAGVEFYPIVAVSDDEYLSASFDGVSMDETVICECKLRNADKFDWISRGQIPPQDYWQVVQQFAVCDTADRCIYVCGDGTDEGAVHLMVSREVIADDIQELISAWRQFDADVAAYVPTRAKAAPVAAPVEGFGSLMLRVEGRVLASNLDAFKAGAEAFIKRLPRPADLQTDQDFSEAEAAVKACAEAESRIKAAKDVALAQMADVDAVMRAADTIAETIRAARLSLNKAVSAEKENRKSELVRSGIDAVREHYACINATLQGFELGVPASLTSDIGGSIKGLKSLDSMRDKIAAAVAQAKIAASQEADRRRLCIAVIDEHAEHRALIPDAATLVAGKSHEDLRNLIAARIAEHQQREQARLDAERARIRAEEEARAQRAAKEEAERMAEEARERIRREEQTLTGEPKEVSENGVQKTILALAGMMARSEEPPEYATPVQARIKLGDVNAAIAPLKIDAAGLAELGFQPVGTEGAAKLYANLPKIVSALINHLHAVAANHGRVA